MASKDNKKQQTSTVPAQKSKEDPAQGWWFCPHCSEFHTLQVLKCTGCNRKKDGADAVAAKPVNARAETVNAWANAKAEDGDVVMAPVDPELEKSKLEEGIRALKAIDGQEAAAKVLEEQLKNLLKKKPVMQSPEKTCMSVAKSLTDVKEKAARQVSQAEQKLEKVTSVKTDLEKKQIAHQKRMKEEYEEKVRVSQEAYDKEKLRLEEEERQEKLKLEEVKRATAAEVAQTKLAMGNVAAVASGSEQRGGAGQQSAGAAAAPGAVLVPTAPGYSLHANDISTQELMQHLLNDPTCSGMTQEMAAAVAASQMRLCQAKSTVVVAAQTGAEPPTGGAAEEPMQAEKEAETRQEGEEDPWTSDDEENEQRLANKKDGETFERVRISRSAKLAKKKLVKQAITK